MAKLSKEERTARLELAKKTAKAKGGTLLTSEYLGVDAKYTWRCSKGHEWESSYYLVVQKKRWCAKCLGRNLESQEYLSQAHSVAEEHGGKCLSNEYKNSTAHLLWECREHHQWTASLNNIKRGKWCPFCAGNKVEKADRLVEAKEYAESREGKCLSDKYEGNKAPMSWQCQEGHTWEASFNTVVNRKAWCAYCVGTTRDPKSQLDEAIRIAASKGGRCLSKEYINNRINLDWECKRGHKWEAPFYSVAQAGSWCPTCSAGLSERIARHTIEQLFNLPFKKKRPEWLINPETGRGMELDGYNKEVGVAFEYQGEQHSRIVKPFKMNTEKLSSQQSRDQMKRDLCKERNMLLIEIPHDIDLIKLPKWLHDQIRLSQKSSQLIDRMQNWKSIKVDEWLESENYSVDDLKRYAEGIGGRGISNTYKGVRVKHEWSCEKGHKWSASWDSIKRGSWCPHCCGNIVEPFQRLEDARTIAKSKGGECLATIYKGANHKMRWRCAKGHEWETKYCHVVQGGSWCPRCMNTKNKCKISSLKR